MFNRQIKPPHAESSLVQARRLSSLPPGNSENTLGYVVVQYGILHWVLRGVQSIEVPLCDPMLNTTVQTHHEFELLHLSPI